MNGKLFRDYDLYSIHAECDALLRGGFIGDTLVVARLLKNGQLGCSRPCDKCMEYIKNSNIKKIIYMDWHNNLVVERINETSTNEYYKGQQQQQWNKYA